MTAGNSKLSRFSSQYKHRKQYYEFMLDTYVFFFFIIMTFAEKFLGAAWSDVELVKVELMVKAKEQEVGLVTVVRGGEQSGVHSQCSAGDAGDGSQRCDLQRG